MSDEEPKLIAIDEEANHQIVHGDRFRKANGTTYNFPFAQSTPHILNFKLPVEISTQPQPLQDCFLYP